MPAQNIHVISEDFKSLKEASEAFALLQKQFRYLQEHIDVENIIAKSLTAEVIKAGAITADEMTVEELSAITAHMGKLISGEIYGAYIATADGTYPRTEMSSTGNLFGAYTAADNAITIVPDFFNSRPAIIFENGPTDSSSISNPDGLDIRSVEGILIQSGTGPIRLVNTSIYGVQFESWSELRNTLTGRSLQQDLDDKADAGTSTGPGGSHNHGIPNGTVLMVNGGGTVTWSTAGTHTHSQT